MKQIAIMGYGVVGSGVAEVFAIPHQTKDTQAGDPQNITNNPERPDGTCDPN